MDVRIPLSTDWNEISDFLTRNLRANVSWTVKDEYPLAFSEGNLANVRYIKDNDSIVAHAVMQPHLIRTQYHLFKVGLIGSVVTSPEHRGRGYSSEIINSCLQAAHKQACDFAVLWTDNFNFYGKFGFELAGSEIACEVPTEFQYPAKESLKFMNTNKIAADALLKLYNNHSLRTLRRAEEVQKYLNIPQSKVYTAWNKMTGQLEAYCVMGKGADFQSYIHEWGGSVSSILATLQHMVQIEKKKLTLITPPQCTNLIQQLEDHGAEKFYGILAMIKIINPVQLCKKIKRGARALGYDSLVFEYRDNKYYFGYGAEIYQTDSDQDIVRLIFGPNKPGQIHKFGKDALEVLNEIFPIPFWVWGWDSI